MTLPSNLVAAKIGAPGSHAIGSVCPHPALPDACGFAVLIATALGASLAGRPGLMVSPPVAPSRAYTGPATGHGKRRRKRKNRLPESPLIWTVLRLLDVVGGLVTTCQFPGVRPSLHSSANVSPDTGQPSWNAEELVSA